MTASSLLYVVSVSHPLLLFWGTLPLPRHVVPEIQPIVTLAPHPPSRAGSLTQPGHSDALLVVLRLDCASESPGQIVAPPPPQSASDRFPGDAGPGATLREPLRWELDSPKTESRW